MTDFWNLLSKEWNRMKLDSEIIPSEIRNQIDLSEQRTARLLYRWTQFRTLNQQSHWSWISQLLTPVACKLYVTRSRRKSNNVLKNSAHYEVREGKEKVYIKFAKTVGVRVGGTTGI
jgi:hypothetical protein